MVHIPGAKHRATDAISRNPTGDPKQMVLTDDIAVINESFDLSDNVSFHDIRHTLLSSIMIDDNFDNSSDLAIQVAAVSSIDSLGLQSITWDTVRIATNSDDDMVKLVELVENGMPEFRHELPSSLREYFQFKEDLYTVDGVVMYRDRIVVPPSLRKSVLSVLHSAHQGISSMMSRAESSVFWPGITPEITNLRNACNHCNRMAPSQPSAPPTPPL